MWLLWLLWRWGARRLRLGEVLPLLAGVDCTELLGRARAPSTNGILRPLERDGFGVAAALETAEEWVEDAAYPEAVFFSFLERRAHDA